ncbi:hypothetical protein FACS1894186_4320 [Alphaproteobacteria bacterium]|nr:hypothetical protein FACS1894186_4320 [Alphaproteobacteria bacterium]
MRRIAGMKSLEAAMRKDFTGGFKYLYVPTFGAEVEELDQLCYLLVAANAGYAQGQHQAKTTLVVDELDQSFPSGITQRNPRNGFAYLCRRGRHYGINLVGISQRTAQVDVCFRGNLSGAYYFRHADQLDIDKAVQTLGRQYRAQMQGLKNFCYIYQSNGVVNIKNN